MGFLKDLKNVNKLESNLEQMNKILITTTETIPGVEYEIIDLVTADKMKLANASPGFVAAALREKAFELGADAIVGFNAFGFHNAVNGVTVGGYGTAVRFTNREGDSE